MTTIYFCLTLKFMSQEYSYDILIYVQLVIKFVPI